MVDDWCWAEAPPKVYRFESCPDYNEGPSSSLGDSITGNASRGVKMWVRVPLLV